MSDDFEDGVTAPEWTVLAGTGLTLAETAGFLQITFAANVPASQVAGYATTGAMDLTGACVIAELAMEPNPASGAIALVRAGLTTDCVEIEVINGMLYALQLRGAANTQLPIVAFDPIAERFIRMRERAGTWYFEVSADDNAYSLLGTVPDTFAAQTSAPLRLTAGDNAAVGGGGVVQFGSVRVLVP